MGAANLKSRDYETRKQLAIERKKKEIEDQKVINAQKLEDINVEKELISSNLNNRRSFNTKHLTILAAMEAIALHNTINI